jgi:branched-chain amino acid transport system substrate-binding protein
MSRRPGSVLLLVLLAFALAGCASSGGGGGSTVSGDVLRIYSSQPLKGRSADRAQAIVRGERLALADAGGRVGKRRVELIALDDSDPETGTWDPGVVSANARKAAQDDKTIAYLGEMDTGASAVAIPILNETDILEVSPTDTVAGFTRDKGAGPGEPDKYYPTRDRNFVRHVPPDDVQAAALLTLLQDEKATKAFVVEDGKLYGQALARQFVRGAKAKGVDVVKTQPVDLDDVDVDKLAAEIAASGADAFVYSGEWHANTVALFQAVAGAAPKIKLFGADALADDAFAAELGDAGDRTFITAPWRALKDYPAEAKAVAKRYEERYHEPMPPQALYGYEAMGGVLAAIQRAGKDGNDRGKVIDEMFDTRNRSSVLGTYSVDEDGDTSIKSYGSYRVRDGRLVFLRVLDPLGA